MAAHQEDVSNLNRLIDEIMRDNVEAVEEVQLKNQPEEEVRWPRVSPLTLTGVTRGPKGRKQKEVTMLDAETGQEIDVETDRREREEVPDSILPETEEEPLRTSQTYPLFPEVQEQVPIQEEASGSREGNAEIMEMLRAMKK